MEVYPSAYQTHAGSLRMAEALTHEWVALRSKAALKAREALPGLEAGNPRQTISPDGRSQPWLGSGRPKTLVKACRKAVNRTALERKQ